MKGRELVYDSTEEILLDKGPYYNLTLGDRVTAMDIEAKACGDDLVNPAEKPKLTKSLLTIEGMYQFISGIADWSEEQCFFQNDTIPTFMRKGAFHYKGMEFAFDFWLMGEDCDERISSLDTIDEIVKSKNYLISFGLHSPTDVDGLKINYPFFDAAIVKTFDGRKEQNELDRMRLDANVRSCPDEDVPKIFSQNYFDFVVLCAKIAGISAQYKEGAPVDPLKLASDFLWCFTDASEYEKAEMN